MIDILLENVENVGCMNRNGTGKANVQDRCLQGFMTAVDP